MIKLRKLFESNETEESTKATIQTERVAPVTRISVTYLPKKPSLHLSHGNGRFVPVSPEDKLALDYEFGANNYGKPHNEDPTMRYFDVNDVVELLFEFNIVLSDDEP